MIKILFVFSSLFLFNFTSISYSNDCEKNDGCLADIAIKNAQENRIKDSSSELFSCMLSNWHAEINISKSKINENIEAYTVFGYERFLACYRSVAGHGAAGEIGVDTEKRKVANGTRFRAEVLCKSNVCETAWIDKDCCYDLDLVKY
ncbi:MAG: hypothetical protein CMJ05_07505 [Pelagibacterales bacterium]|nr:hypothetical protein [Pelagibacterales bacterium]|tara:strand:- start:178 stop:618 length:441 start_codon:yes stop_codon:yes gene_type:complete